MKKETVEQRAVKIAARIMQRAKADVVRHIAEHVAGQVALEYDRRTNTVIGTWEVK